MIRSIRLTFCPANILKRSILFVIPRLAKRADRPKAPSSNIQAPEKFQTPKLQEQRRWWVRLLVLGASLDVGAWNLEL
jgi:hypothetical protein